MSYLKFLKLKFGECIKCYCAIQIPFILQKHSSPKINKQAIELNRRSLNYYLNRLLLLCHFFINRFFLQDYHISYKIEFVINFQR
jgi:hypothetical protein